MTDAFKTPSSGYPRTDVSSRIAICYIHKGWTWQPYFGHKSVMRGNLNALMSGA
jgi:hypothetical protein